MAEPKSAAKDRHLRPLLPSLVREPPPPVSPAKRPPKRIAVISACNACRVSRYKCSGGRPTCGRCERKRIPCQYSTQPGETPSQALRRSYNALQHYASAHEELFELLRTLPDQEANDVLRRIRSGDDATAILNQVKASDILLQMAVAPEARFRYELPYRSEMPTDYLQQNPYLDSLIYETSSLYSANQPSNSTSEGNSNTLGHLSSNEYRSFYLKPFHAAQVIDTLLSDAKMSSWTIVCNDDVLMRDLLGVFFRCEYHFTMAFQKTYFLEDMAAQRTDFCSSLLVNVVLAYACVCYPHFSNRAEYWNPHTFHYRFLAEARRLWELEAKEARITTVQAGIVFNVIHNLSGLDQIGQAYRIQAIALAHKLRIFDSSVKFRTKRLRNGTAYTAWALYNWESLVGFSFMIRPLLTKAPDWPLPDPSTDPTWYGEVWVKYPADHILLPSYFGHVFRAKSQFRVIMNEFCQIAYAKDSAVTSEKATELRLWLESWYNDLSPPLQPRFIVLPAQLQLHMYYHHLMLSIYKPLVGLEAGDEETSARKIVADATKHLQTLVRLYYIRHGFDAMDLFIVIPLMHVGFECTTAITGNPSAEELEALRATLFLIAKGLYGQRRNHYLAEALFRVIRGRMNPPELSLLKSTMVVEDAYTEGEQEMAQAVHSHWPVTVVKKEDMDSHMLTTLVEDYANLNME